MTPQPDKNMQAKAYAHFATEAGMLANEIEPRGDDQEYKDERLQCVAYLKIVASKLRRLSEVRAMKEGVTR